jgi:hypothetical protein
LGLKWLGPLTTHMAKSIRCIRPAQASGLARPMPVGRAACDECALTAPIVWWLDGASGIGSPVDGRSPGLGLTNLHDIRNTLLHWNLWNKDKKEGLHREAVAHWR